MTREEKKLLKDLESRLNYKFKKREHLKRALTHKSYANELHLPPTEHNERYEFLGDAVLELSISHLLMENFPTHPEGKLSKLRAAMVNEAALAGMAKRVNLGEYIYLGRGEDRTGGRAKPSILSDAFEAVLGAVYLDRGFKKAFDLIRRHFLDAIQATEGKGFHKDYKTRLQEVAQGKFRAVPKYRLIEQKGPDHCKTFIVDLFIKEEHYGTGQGYSKKASEQDAARQALEKLGVC